MVGTSAALTPTGVSKAHINESRRFFRVMLSRRLVIFGMVIIFLLIFAAIFAPLISPYSPYKVNLPESMQQPSWHHLLGTDEMGRDVLTRIIYGSRIAVLVGFVVVTLAGAIGMLLGLLAGYFGGWTQTIIMRFMDALMSLPPLILMLAIAVMLGSGMLKIFIALAVGFMPTYCRLMCGEVLSAKENDYIMAANVIGDSHLRIMFRHLLPNVFPPLFVNITLDLGFAILAEASLSFLGIGINPPTATWGAMINGGQHYLLTNPLLSIVPGVAIVLVVLAFNLVGDGLRDALDPRLRGRI
ncbi:MAG: ABC transporter permease [Dehalococcoidales bacterium]|jgi:ABC-type dipeptide/oligopeptide/nickel transport system permease subunit